MLAKNKVLVIKGSTQLFCVTPNYQKAQITLHYISLNILKNTTHKHISLTRTNHCNSKLSKNNQFKIDFFSSSIFQKI